MQIIFLSPSPKFKPSSKATSVLEPGGLSLANISTADQLSSLKWSIPLIPNWPRKDKKKCWKSLTSLSKAFWTKRWRIWQKGETIQKPWTCRNPVSNLSSSISKKTKTMNLTTRPKRKTASLLRRNLSTKLSITSLSSTAKFDLLIYSDFSYFLFTSSFYFFMTSSQLFLKI